MRLTAALTGFVVNIVLIASLSLTASAGQQAIDEVVVTAVRMPVARSELAASSTSTLIPDELRAFQGLDFTEALVSVPGLFVQSHYNAAQDLRVDLRGFGARGNFGIRGIRIYVDDMPESLPDGQVQVDTVDPQDIRRIVILRGPSASLYGNAAGGVILIETVPVGEAPPWRLSYSLGAYGFGNLAASARFAGPGRSAFTRLSVTKQKLDGYRQHARSETLRLAADFQIRIDERDVLEVRARATDAPTALDPGGLTFLDFRRDGRRAAANNVAFNAGEILDQQSLAWRWKREFDETSGLQLSNYFTWRDFENRLPFRDAGAVVLGRRVGGAGLQYRWQPGQFGRWAAGLDLDQQRDGRRRFDNLSGELGELRLDQLEEVTVFGAFLATDHRLSRSLTLQAALRFDALRLALSDRFLADGDQSGTRRFSKLSPGLGLRLDVSQALSVYGRYSTSFETPTTTELANPNGAGFNPELMPQSSRAWEIGLRHGARAGSFFPELEAAVYHVEVSDELVGFELPAQPGRNFFANAAESRRRGIEFSAGIKHDESVGLRLSAAWSDSQFKRFVQDDQDFSGNRIPGSPGIRLAGSLSWRPTERWLVDVDAARVWRVFADNANKVRSPDFLDAGLRVAYGFTTRTKRVECYAGVRNLLGERFADNLRKNAFGGRYFEPAPPRHLYAGLRVSARNE